MTPTKRKRAAAQCCAAAFVAGVVIVSGALVATPAFAKNSCGPLNVYKDGLLSNTGHVTQSCDAGTQAIYTVRCLFGSAQFTRYYPAGQTATTNINCSGTSNPIRTVTVSYT